MIIELITDQSKTIPFVYGLVLFLLALTTYFLARIKNISTGIRVHLYGLSVISLLSMIVVLVNANHTGWSPAFHVPLVIPSLFALLMLWMGIVVAVMWKQTGDGVTFSNSKNQRIQLQQAALKEIINSPYFFTGDVFSATREMTERMLKTLDTDFASIWIYDGGKCEFRLEDRCSSAENTHVGGEILKADKCREGFGLLEEGHAIVLDNCANATRFGGMMPIITVPGVKSAMIAPFRVYGKIGGFATISQTKKIRRWEADEIRFASEIADQVSHLLVNADRVHCETTLAKAHTELEIRVQERTAELSRENKNLRREVAERLRVEEDRRKLETHIQQTQKLESLGVMAGGVAHDFNNILMAILGNVEMAKLNTPDGSAINEYLEDIDKAGHRAAELARQMLAYSGRGHSVIQAIDINRLVNDMMRILETTVGKSARIQCDLEDNLPPVDGDAAQIGQVLMNLVINGAEAIEGGGGIVTVRTGTIWCDSDMFSTMWLAEKLPEGRYVFLEVMDSGCGMSPETLPRIFDPFFTTKFTGRGLGLAAVLGIVRGHHGAIDVSSELGKGSTFRILVPVGQLAVELSRSAPTSNEIVPQRGTILLVDDEEPIRILGKRMLERLGFSVLVAADGREAVAVFHDNRHSIRCVLMDLTMPHLDGRAALKALRTIDPTVKVIMSSGFPEADIAAKFRDLNLAGILPKPYLFEMLSSRIRAALAS